MKKNNNILILTHWSYEDALIQAYTLPYVFIIRKNIESGRRIILVTFEQEHLKMDEATLAEKRKFLHSRGIELITLNYSNFKFSLAVKFLGYISKLIYIIKNEKVGIIHAWCTPAGSLGYLLCKLTGRKLIIDSYEPHAEAMVENNTWKRSSLKYRVLFFLEKKLSNFASVLISATEGMKKYAADSYKIVPKYFLVKPACVNNAIFNIDKRKNPKLLKEFELENKIVCVYAGKFDGIYLTKEVFKIFKAAEDKWGESFRALVLTNHSIVQLQEWAIESDFSLEKLICKFVSYEDIPYYMGLGDFAITPVKPIPTKRYCSPIKDGEYWALGLPVIITKDISDDSDIIRTNDIGYVLENFSVAEFKKAVDKIESLLLLKEVLTHKISNIALEYRSYSIAEDIYRKIYKENYFNLD